MKSKSLIYKNKKINVSTFAPTHPGGDVIYEFLNNDITDVFQAMHGPESRAHVLVNTLPVLDDNVNSPTTELQRDFRTLAKELSAQCKDERVLNLVYWLFDLFIVTLIGGVGIYVLLYSNLSMYLKLLVGGASLALVFFQAGWLTHDIAHKTVTSDPNVIKPLTHLYGNLVLGYSYDWWRKKHNRRHHPLTNVIGKDEDIDTMPFIAWDEHLADNTWFVRHQHILTWILLLVSRFVWRTWSILHVIKERIWDELVFIIAHYVIYATLLNALGYSLVTTIIFAVIVDMVSGFLTGYVFLQSHNAKQVGHSIDTDFWTHQIRSTSNIKESYINNKFSGYLNMQIEHHLLPWLPRRMLKIAQPRVKALCKKHNLSYQEYGWAQSTYLIYKHLHKIAKSVNRM